MPRDYALNPTFIIIHSMRLTLTLLSIALNTCCAMAALDTLKVERLQMWEPARTFHPYQADSTNTRGQKIDSKEVLTKNPRLSGTPTRTLSWGEALPHEAGTISQYAFRLRSSRYAKAQVKVDGVSNFRLYDEDGSELSDGNVTLLQEERTVRMVVLAAEECKDTMKVSVVCDSIYADHVSINPEGRRPYSWEDMTLGRQYGSSRVSPTGRYILQAYYNTRRNGEWDQWAVLTDLKTGKVMRRIEGSTGWKWLEGEDLLYYTRTRDAHTQLVTFDPRDERETIIADDLPEASFTLSPRRDYLIYSVTDEGKSVKGSLKLMEAPDDRMPGWRKRSALWRMDLKTGVRQPLTFGGVSMWLADISSDGRKLLISCSRNDLTKRPFSRTTLLEMDAYTGVTDTILLEEPFVTGDANYLPGDRQLILTGTCNAFNNVGCELPDGKIGNAFQHCVFFYDMDKREASYPMPRGFMADITSMTVCAADGSVYLHGDNGYDSSLFRLDQKTNEVKQVMIPITFVSRYGIATAQRRPTIVASGQNMGMESRLCVIGREGEKFVPFGELTPLTNENNTQMSECKTWEFLSSRGDSIKCFYYDNGEGRENGSKPMIVYYYGGCSPTPRVAEFLYPFQVWAAQGYTVLVVEPSGASGFGQEFGSRHVGTWGEGSSQDIIEATQQFCREHAFINPKKIGCIGASYGGFMTQYLQTRTDIFAAAISHAGISNIASYWGGGYWGYSYGEVAEYGQFPWSDKELFVEHSPLFNAEKIKTPLLLLHGTVDTNVPTNESQQLYTALKILGKEVAYITIDGENHVVSDFKKRGEWARTIQAWFAKWLKDQPQWWDDLYTTSK